MAGWKTRAEVAAIRKRYPAGSRIELEYMNEQGMQPGLKGIVKSVDDAGQLHMIWESSRRREEGETGFMPAPTFLDVLVINEDGEPRLINDETHMFRFMRIKTKGEAHEHD